MVFIKPRRYVDWVQIHCSASDRPEDDSVEVMREWHLARDFDDVGYHYFTRKDGLIQEGRSLERIPAGIKGHNERAIAICLHGLAIERFTAAQFQALRDLADQIDAAYGHAIRYVGHRELAAKACPVFDYRTVLGLDERGYRTRIGRDPVAAVPGRLVELPGARVLRRTDRGPDVAFLQHIVGAEVDGLFGQETTNKLRTWQGEQGLAVDGIAGPRTWARIYEVAQAMGIDPMSWRVPA